jgi:hypothetical protein
VKDHARDYKENITYDACDKPNQCGYCIASVEFGFGG